MTPIPGFDTFGPVTDALVAQVQTEVGLPPAFCGRYFSGTDYHGPGEYASATETPVLARHGLALLPVGRYTPRVGGSQADGLQDGQSQANDLVVSLGAAFRSGLYLFLDVETDTPLSAAYWTGWAQAVAAAGCLPAIYGSVFAGGATWTALRQAMTASQAPCAGIWGAYYKQAAPSPIPAWTAEDTVPLMVEGSRFTDVPVLIWQYCGDFQGVDASLVNPAQAETLMAHLAVPGATVPPRTGHEAKVFSHNGKASVVLDGQVYALASLSINGARVPLSGSSPGGVS
jgi:hypothetical protein